MGKQQSQAQGEQGFGVPRRPPVSLGDIVEVTPFKESDPAKQPGGTIAKVDGFIVFCDSGRVGVPMRVKIRKVLSGCAFAEAASEEEGA